MTFIIQDKVNKNVGHLRTRTSDILHCWWCITNPSKAFLFSRREKLRQNPFTGCSRDLFHVLTSQPIFIQIQMLDYCEASPSNTPQKQQFLKGSLYLLGFFVSLKSLLNFLKDKMLLSSRLKQLDVLPKMLVFWFVTFLTKTFSISRSSTGELDQI